MYINQKNKAKAIEFLKKEIKNNPKSAEAYYLLGNLMAEKEDFVNAIDNYNKSIDSAPKFAKDIENQKQYFWATNYNKGVGFLNKASNLTDKSKAGEYFSKAEKALTDAILCQPDSAITYKTLADLLLFQKRLDKAIEPLKKAISLSPDASTYVKLGSVYIQKGNNDEALNILKKAEAKYPDNVDVLTTLTQIYISTGKIDIALESTKKLVEKDPENKYLRYTYGTLLYNANRLQEAIEQLRATLDIDPEYLDAMQNLAAAYVANGIEMRKKAEEEESNSEAYKEEFKKALEILNEYIDIKDDNSTIWESLGTVYGNLGMTKESKEAFAKADALK